MANRELNTLLLDLYRCPTDYTRWPAVLDSICGALQVRSAVIQLLNAEGPQTRTCWMARDSRSESERAKHDRLFGDTVNPRLRAPGRSTPRKLPPVVRDTDLFDIADPIYTDLQQRLAAVQFGMFISVRIELSAHQMLALVLHRDGNDHRDFSSHDERLALQMMPHFRQAIQLTSALEHKTAHTHDLDQILNQIRFALLLCSADGTVHWMNQAAEKTLSQGHCLSMVDKRLRANSSQENAKLKRIIANAANTPGTDHKSMQQLLVLHDQTTNAELQVRAQALEVSNTTASGLFMPQCTKRVLLMLADPGAHPVLPAGLLGSLFTLSPAESRLAAALCTGVSLSEYAQQHDVSVGTVRYQLKQVMAKTRVSRQSQLIQRLYSSVIAHTIGSH